MSYCIGLFVLRLKRTDYSKQPVKANPFQLLWSRMNRYWENGYNLLNKWFTVLAFWRYAKLTCNINTRSKNVWQWLLESSCYQFHVIPDKRGFIFKTAFILVSSFNNTCTVERNNVIYITGNYQFEVYLIWKRWNILRITNKCCLKQENQMFLSEKASLTLLSPAF